jgi:hypothetical protein
MTSGQDGKAKTQHGDLSFFCAAHLDESQVARWREFADRVPWADYRQDPGWAEIERRGRGAGARQPWFFWAEADGAVCLTAIGVSRRLPVPGRVFWEFSRGPTVLDESVLDEWLSWFLRRVHRRAARLRLAPAMHLDDGGDDVETLLERRGFVRRRTLGGWATLLVDISCEEEDVMAAFRYDTRSNIKKSRRLGIEIHPGDDPAGWGVLSALQTDLSRLTPVRPVDRSEIERVSRHWLRGGSGGTILVARHDGEALAAALVVTHRGSAHLQMIPSSRHHREVPASHLLLWEAMRWAKRHQCTVFDLGGYSLVARPGDALWGVNTFKRGFAPPDRLRKSVAIHEFVLSPAILASAAAIRKSQARWRGRSRQRSE